MSLVLNMVGGGGGSLSATDAILRVIATAGSTVTITKGTTVKTDLGHENADDHTLYDYYFIIHASQFDSVNPWTVLVEQGSLSKTKTVIIDSADEYDVSAKILIIYDLGNENSAVTGGIVKKKGISDSAYGTGTMTKNADNIYVYAGDSQGCAAVTTNKINVTGYKTLCVYATAAGGSSQPRLCFTNDSNGGITNNIANKQFSTTGQTNLDISSVGTKTGYVSMRCLGANHTNSNVTFTKLWVED